MNLFGNKAKENQQTQMQMAAVIVDLNTRMDALVEKILQLEKTRDLSPEQIRLYTQLSEQTGTSFDQCRKVIHTYKQLKEAHEKTAQQKIWEQMQARKKSIGEKNFRNCSICGEPLEEGEYYKRMDGSVACLTHLNKGSKVERTTKTNDHGTQSLLERQEKILSAALKTIKRGRKPKQTTEQEQEEQPNENNENILL